MLGNVALDILREVASIDNVDLLERVEQVARYGIAVAIFQEEHAATIRYRRSHLCNLIIATHKRAVGIARAVVKLKEVLASNRPSVACYGVVLVDDIVNLCGLVLNVARCVIDKVFG